MRGAKRTVFIASGPGTSDLTGTACSPNTLHWTYDTYATSSAVAKALLAQGGKSWYFITAEYAFGAALERDATKVITTSKRVNQTDSTDAPAVMAAMKFLPADDDAFGKRSVRQDGRALHDFNLFQVKKPSESTGPWDDYELISTIPGDQAFRPMAEGGCPMVKYAAVTPTTAPEDTRKRHRCWRRRPSTGTGRGRNAGGAARPRRGRAGAGAS